MKTMTILLALALASVQAQAQVAPVAGTRAVPMTQPVAKAKLHHADRKFIDQAAEGGMFEVQVAQLAASKANDPQVKSFADMLVDQHTAANNELLKIATAKGVELPPTPRHGQRREIDKLGKRNGADFDEHFVREVGVKAHEKDIRMFEKAGKDVKDPELKAFIDKTLPTLRDHLAAAEKLPQSGRNVAAMGANKH